MDVLLHMPWNRLSMGHKVCNTSYLVSVIFLYLTLFYYVAQFRRGPIMFTAPNLALAFIHEEGYFLQLFCEMRPEYVFYATFCTFSKGLVNM